MTQRMMYCRLSFDATQRMAGPFGRKIYISSHCRRFPFVFIGELILAGISKVKGLISSVIKPLDFDVRSRKSKLHSHLIA
ncbi:hypothetical protein SE17_00055 [Kouleothrix aurantiaca]|uniref:Uncharacterized protein n=1 Tax=Kouleothrix aurantiaca TaxID=186479 RepID=A0A0P9DHN7_9CHLR|nr:hypothetical protein SE17_00055 [Kouleothrix aurantiaca]